MTSGKWIGCDAPSAPIAMTATAAWRRRHPEVAELDRLAALEFGLATDVDQITAEGFLAAARLHAPAIAVAAALAGMNKAHVLGLVRLAQARADGTDEEMALMLADAREAFRATVALLDDATARLNVALAALAAELPDEVREPGE